MAERKPDDKHVPLAPALPDEPHQSKTDEAMEALTNKLNKNTALKERMRQKEMQFTLVGAIENLNINEIQELIDEGVNIDAEIVYTKTPLTHAIELKHDSVALQLLANGCDPNLAIDEFPFSKPIHLAAKENLPNVIEKLVQYKADVNARDHDSMSALHIASFYGHVDSVRTLLNCGAYINMGDSCIRTPIHRAVENGCVDVVKTLMEDGADINVTDIKGWTPLHLAIAYDFKDIFDLLIKSKCQLDEPDLNGRTPLAIACNFLNRDNVDIVTETQFYYYRRMADVVEGRYLNLLHRPGDMREMLEIVMSLVNAGANVDGADVPPIAEAIYADHGNTVCILVNAGAWIPPILDSLSEDIPENFKMRKILAWIKSRFETQFSLLRQCKRKIRKRLAETCNNIENGIDRLPLPILLKTFLK